LPSKWNEDFKNQICSVIEAGLSWNDALWSSLSAYKDSIKDKAKKVKIKGFGSDIQKTAQVQYFHLTEPLIHRMLRETSLRDFARSKVLLIDDLSRICSDIFERVTLPFTHKPELIGTVAVARVKLKKLLAKLKNADQIIVLDEGRIVGKGKHHELMESCEVYRNIALSQLSQKELA
jgi:hypothetical protein